MHYVLEAAPLAGDGVSQAIARTVTLNQSAPDYLSEIEEMIECWVLHRNGQLEAFAHQIKEIGEGLTLQTFSEAKLTFLRDALESMNDPEERIRQRLGIASLLMEIARWEEAEEQVRPALAETQSLANAELAASASTLLATLLLETNRIKEAEQLLRQALEIDNAALGNQHRAVATHLNNLAMLLGKSNRIEEAERLMRQALEIDEAILDDQHPTVATHLHNLAFLLMDSDRPEEAAPLLRRALDIYDAIHAKTGHEHPHHQQTKATYRALQQSLQQTV